MGAVAAEGVLLAGGAALVGAALFVGGSLGAPGFANVGATTLAVATAVAGRVAALGAVVRSHALNASSKAPCAVTRRSLLMGQSPSLGTAFGSTALCSRFGKIAASSSRS